MATSAPVVEKVTRTRVLTPAEAAQDKPARTTPEFWEFIERMTPEMWGSDFILYILREDPKPSLYGGTNTLEKCPGYISMMDGTKQPLSSREDIELAIKQKYGGKAFRLILKRANGERISEGKCINEAPPRYPDANTQPFAAPLPNAGSSDGVAIKAMDTIANQNPQLINIAIDAVSRAAEIVSRHSAPPATVPPAPSSLDQELEREFKRAMIARMTAPPVDPLETYIRIRDVIGGGNNNGGGVSTSANTLLEKVLTAAVDKILNPPAPISGRTTLLDLGREVLPALINGGKDIMHEYRLSMEAQAQIAATQRSMPPQPQPVPVAPIPPPALAQAAPNPPQPQPVPAPQQATMTFPQVAAYIANVVKNAQHTTDEAVEDVLAFLYNCDPRLVGLLLDPPKLDPQLKPGKDGLMMLFTFEPSLATCLTNVPRVSEFIDKFIVAATESEAAEARLRAAAPAAQPV